MADKGGYCQGSDILSIFPPPLLTHAVVAPGAVAMVISPLRIPCAYQATPMQTQFLSMLNSPKVTYLTLLSRCYGTRSLNLTVYNFKISGAYKRKEC